MHARLMTIAAALTLASAGAAEPAKKPAVQQAPSATRAAVMLASADQAVRAAPATEAAIAIPVKRPRASRVTSCRCGDPQTPQQEP